MTGISSIEDKGSLLKEGDVAPMFRFEDESGREISLADLRGRKVALFFYPKDFTPGCTNEVCNLRDNYQALRDANIYIIGVSADESKRHDRFRSKFKLPFPLIADTDKKIITSYGVWGRKRFMGMEFDGIKRSTFIINEEGKIASIITQVKSKNHSQQILDSINS